MQQNIQRNADSQQNDNNQFWHEQIETGFPEVEQPFAGLHIIPIPYSTLAIYADSPLLWVPCRLLLFRSFVFHILASTLDNLQETSGNKLE